MSPRSIATYARGSAPTRPRARNRAMGDFIPLDSLRCAHRKAMCRTTANPTIKYQVLIRSYATPRLSDPSLYDWIHTCFSLVSFAIASDKVMPRSRKVCPGRFANRRLSLGAPRLLPEFSGDFLDVLHGVCHARLIQSASPRYAAAVRTSGADQFRSGLPILPTIPGARRHSLPSRNRKGKER